MKRKRLEIIHQLRHWLLNYRGEKSPKVSDFSFGNFSAARNKFSNLKCMNGIFTTAATDNRSRTAVKDFPGRREIIKNSSEIISVLSRFVVKQKSRGFRLQLVLDARINGVMNKRHHCSLLLSCDCSESIPYLKNSY